MRFVRKTIAVSPTRTGKGESSMGTRAELSLTLSIVEWTYSAGVEVHVEHHVCY